jgi:hypothetical protein
LAAAAILHLKVPLAKRVRPLRKIIAGKLSAIPQAIFHLVQLCTGQNGAGAGQQPLLGGKLLSGLGAGARAATGAGAQQI